MIQRRAFLKGSTAALLAAGAGPIALFAPASRSGDGSFGAFSRARFAALVNRRFFVEDDGWQPLELVALRDGPPSAVVEQFTLVFRGVPGTEIAEGTHRIDCDGIGDFAVFLQPSGADEAGPTFVASFTLFRPPSCAATG